MPTAATNYQSVPDMVRERDTVSRNKFFVFVAGTTNEAHHDFVKKFKNIGHTEVNSPGECDYILVFCPVASRVGTDVNEALDKIPAGKPTILVVMHHTFNPEHVVAESRRLVNNPDVHLTVDCLFCEDHFLESEQNDAAWSKIRESHSQVFPKKKSWVSRKCCICVGLLVGAVLVVIIVSVTVINSKKT